MKVMRAEPRPSGQRRQRRSRGRRFDRTTDVGDLRGIALGQWRFGGPASAARTEAGSFGVGDRRVEFDVFPIRPPGATGWAAIDTGRPDRVPERAVGVVIARHHRRPPRIVHTLNMPCAAALDTPSFAVEFSSRGGEPRESEAQAFEVAADGAVTFARGGFEAFAIEDRDLPVLVSDEPGFLQRA